MSTPAQREYDDLVASSHTFSRVHPEDYHPSDGDSDVSSDHDGATTLHSTEERSIAPSNSSTIMPTATYLPATTTQFDANTGPKGVIADARSFETAKKRSFRQTLHAFTDASPFKKLNPVSREKSKSPSPDLSTDEEEDDFMRQWRQKRLDELATMKQEIRTRRQSPSKRRYGSLVAVDPAGYLDAVEKVGAETVVVVLIYDDQVHLLILSYPNFCHYTLSNKVEDALTYLARKHPTTRFVKLHYQDAEMDEVAAPGVLAYRASECFANLVSFITEIPAGKDVNTATVEEVLERYIPHHESIRNDADDLHRHKILI
ncbi:uncharacterized protein KY384_004858 [Bacidia gigantensis]|uniref:uncharacterized protein n=1 Tax=Bacidia gigantensis TaxID=2732470 RepID=UPI001D044E1D|nr:uncharacterized protein KY384_004858 [Bacidia gigantensis]KAG8530356.1 hypothetical protein KY384_004858 [Bacidia gigantensis]